MFLKCLPGFADPNYEEYGTDEFPLTLEPRLVRANGFAVTVDGNDVIRPSSVQTEYSTFTYFVTSLAPGGATVTSTDIVVSSNVVTRTEAAGPVQATPSLPQQSFVSTEISHSKPFKTVLKVQYTTTFMM